MTWNDIRNPDKIPAALDSVEKILTKNELADSCRGGLSRPEMAMEFYPEARYTIVRCLHIMKAHDPRCQGPNDQKLLDDVAEYGWHVMKVLDQPDTPGWAYSIGLHRTFDHPEVLIFGQDMDLMHSMINTIGDGVSAGKTFEVDGRYPDLIEAYSCTFRPVKSLWYEAFLGFAMWFYGGARYPGLQWFWPCF